MLPATTDNNNQSTEVKLTPKNRLFVESILNGEKVLTAYHNAGYKGSVTAAYMLKHRLQRHIDFYVSQRVSLTDTLNEIEKLNEMPLMSNGQITFNQKLRLIQLKIQALKAVKETTPKEQKFTAFVINSDKDKGTTVSVGEVQDAEVVTDVNSSL